MLRLRKGGLEVDLILAWYILRGKLVYVLTTVTIHVTKNEFPRTNRPQGAVLKPGIGNISLSSISHIVEL